MIAWPRLSSIATPQVAHDPPVKWMSLVAPLLNPATLLLGGLMMLGLPNAVEQMAIPVAGLAAQELAYAVPSFTVFGRTPEADSITFSTVPDRKELSVE